MLKVEDLNVSFPKEKQTVYSVRGVSFEVFEGESVGIVGESGCGKTTLALAIKNLLERAEVEGKILFDGADTQIGMIFQSPMTSLNPTMRIQAQIAEGMIYHGLLPRKAAKMRALELLELVGIDHPSIRAKQYPHELSGGQRQRVTIAIALACNPRLLIADEPTTALDVTVQAQIIHLIQDIRKKLNMSLLLISHDLGVINKLCDRVLVFYAGKIVEQGPTHEVLQTPKHPYTQMLLQSRPSLALPRINPLRVIEGSPPSLTSKQPGCAFLERCPHRSEVCKKEPPFFGSAACWRRS